MNKAVVFLLVIALTGFAFVSCEKDVVTYCPFCGQANLKEVSNFNMTSGKSEVYYQCQNSNCGKAFGAGQP
jgi:ribosomal protein L44E